MKLKKICIIALLVCFTISLFSVNLLSAFAGIPPYAPIYELILIDSNEALSVASQTITLAPSIKEEPSRYNPNMPDNLSSVYKIENKADAVRSRLAVLHFGNVFDDLAKYQFNANGAALSPTVYYKNPNAMFDQTDDYSAILDDAFFEPVVFDDSLCGTLYEFTAEPMAHINFALAANQKMIHSANGSSISSGVSIATSGYLYSSSGLVSVFVTEGSFDYSCSSGVEVESTVISYNDFLADMDFPLEDGSSLTSLLFMSNAFDSFLNGYNDYISFGDLYNVPSCRVLVYDVDFLAGANTLSLVRPIRYTYSYIYEPPLFAVHIKSAPLKTWTDFGTTNINITTPPDLPYILDDDLSFQKTADNTFNFSGDITSFDEYYIVYCESDNPKNTDDEKNKKLIWWIVGSVAISLGVGIGVYLLVSFIQKRKSQR